jgi:hypothetical protein
VLSVLLGARLVLGEPRLRHSFLRACHPGLDHDFPELVAIEAGELGDANEDGRVAVGSAAS